MHEYKHSRRNSHANTTHGDYNYKHHRYHTSKTSPNDDDLNGRSRHCCDCVGDVAGPSHVGRGKLVGDVAGPSHVGRGKFVVDTRSSPSN